MVTNRLNPTTLCLLLCCSIASLSLTAQSEAPQLKNFQISIENTTDGIAMDCQVGCAWLESAFTTRDAVPVMVNELGTTPITHDSTEDGEQLVAFQFSITKSGNTIYLEGIEGTAWKKLSFTLATNNVQKNRSERDGRIAKVNDS